MKNFFRCVFLIENLPEHFIIQFNFLFVLWNRVIKKWEHDLKNESFTGSESCDIDQFCHCADVAFYYSIKIHIDDKILSNEYVVEAALLPLADRRIEGCYLKVKHQGEIDGSHSLHSQRIFIPHSGWLLRWCGAVVRLTTKGPSVSSSNPVFCLKINSLV